MCVEGGGRRMWLCVLGVLSCQFYGDHCVRVCVGGWGGGWGGGAMCVGKVLSCDFYGDHCVRVAVWVGGCGCVCVWRECCHVNKRVSL